MHHEAERAGIEPAAITIAETCRFTSLGRTSVFRLIADGSIKTRKVGTRTLVLTESVRRFLNGEAAQ